jgi:hypothetical protein
MFTANRSAGMSDEDNYFPSEHSKGDDVEDDYENLVVPHVASSSDSEDSAAIMPSSIKTVWETKKFEKILDKDGRKMWKSHFCGVERSEWNHPKAWHHAIGGKDVASSKGFLNGRRLSSTGLLPRRTQRRQSKTLMRETWLFLHLRRMFLHMLCIQRRQMPSLLIGILGRLP